MIVVAEEREELEAQLRGAQGALDLAVHDREEIEGKIHRLTKRVDELRLRLHAMDAGITPEWTQRTGAPGELD